MLNAIAVKPRLPAKQPINASALCSNPLNRSSGVERAGSVS